MSNFLSAGDHDHAGEILEWTAQEQEEVTEDKFDRIAVQRGWAGQARDHEVFKVLIHCAEQSHRWDAASLREKRKAQRGNASGRLHMEYAPVTSAIAQGFMKESLEIH